MRTLQVELLGRSDAAPEILVRRFEPLSVEETDGRTLDCLIVPYNTEAMVADPPDFEPYREMFVRGAFTRAEKAPNRVFVDFEHQTEIGNLLGRGLEFEERDDGLHGRLGIFENERGDTALQLVRDKVLEALSVMFKPLKSVMEDGVVKRVAVHLDRVALVRQGAYEAAQVLAVRQATPHIPRLAPMAVDLSDRLKQFGLEGQPNT